MVTCIVVSCDDEPVRHPRGHLQSCPDLVEPEKGARNTTQLTDKAGANRQNNGGHLFPNSVKKMNVLLAIRGKHVHLPEEVRDVQDNRTGGDGKHACEKGHADSSSQHGLV